MRIAKNLPLPTRPPQSVRERQPVQVEAVLQNKSVVTAVRRIWREVGCWTGWNKLL